MPPPLPTALALFLIFSRIGLTSFGGGLSGWFLREFVQDRQWLSEAEFFNGLALSQALPGVNVTNMAIWIGYRLRGRTGALASFAGIVLPAAVTIILLSLAIGWFGRFAVTHLALDGAAAAAVGLSAAMGITAARRLPRRAGPLILMVATFVMVGILHWPLILVVIGCGAAGIALDYAAGPPPA